MKASLTLRDDGSAPLLRAKLPLTVLGVPIISGLAAGNPDDLCLDLTTALDAGPSFRASYRPNDPCSPLSLSLRVGCGQMGSPVFSPMTIAAELGFGPGARAALSFSFAIKPRLGDFVVRKVFQSGPLSCGTESRTELWSGAEVMARSEAPMWNAAAARINWGVRIPAVIRYRDDRDMTAGVSLLQMPHLVVSKVSIHRPVRRKPDLPVKEMSAEREEISDGSGSSAPSAKTDATVAGKSGLFTSRDIPR